MKRASYITTTELIQWLKLGCFVSELKEVVENTKEKDWHRKMACMITWGQKIVNERLDCIELEQYPSVIRRKDHTELVLLTSDQRRMTKHLDNREIEDEITLRGDDVLSLMELAAHNCCLCKQGSYVKNCYYRELFHRLALPVVRDEPDKEKGECEWSHLPVGETIQLSPVHERPEIK